jgi:hypothetical protein
MVEKSLLTPDSVPRFSEETGRKSSGFFNYDSPFLSRLGACLPSSSGSFAGPRAEPVHIGSLSPRSEKVGLDRCKLLSR